jgi:checkpoint serine/threonine-protein kinase
VASSSTASSSSSSSPFNSTAASRYALMMAPPQPGKRPEKLQFDMSLLYTEEAGEYCAQEARARSLGLLGKAWAPLPFAADPPPNRAVSSSQSSTSDRTADSSKHRKSLANRRKSVYGEPTVTINTKEALADVFGMYNSPEKTTRMKPGSKHAPLRNVETVASLGGPPQSSSNESTPKQRMFCAVVSLLYFSDNSTQDHGQTTSQTPRKKTSNRPRR